MADLIPFNNPHKVKRSKQPDPTELDVLQHNLRRLWALSPDDVKIVDFFVFHLLKDCTDPEARADREWRGGLF